MTTTREHYGTYVPVAAVDWGKAIGGLYNTINQIGIDREKQREDLDKLMTESISAINNYDLLKTQSLQDYILAGADNGRTTINNANKQLKSGQITPAQYRAIINNVNTYWSTFSNSMKNFDATNQELMKRQQPGENGSPSDGSDFEAYLSQQHANLGNLRNSSYMFNPETGEGYMVNIDPATGKPSKVTNSMVIADPSNIMDQRFDFRKFIITNTKGMMDAYIVEHGSTTTSNPMENKAVASSVVSTINSCLTNPRMISQVLADFGNYGYYQTEEEKQNIINSRIAEENQVRIAQGKPELTDEEKKNLSENLSSELILVSLDDNNTYQPVITPDQEQDARDLLQDFIIAQFPYKQTEEDGGYRSGRKVGGLTEVKVDNSTQDFANKFVKAMGSGKKSVEKMNELLKARGIQVDWDGSGFDVLKYKDKESEDQYGRKIKGEWEKTQYVNLPWSAEDFWKALGLNESKWIAAVKRAKGQ